MTPRWLLWAEATNLTAVPAIGLVVVILTVLGTLFWAPIGPPTTTMGRVVGSGFYYTKSGRREWTEVEVQGRTVRAAGFSPLCARGDMLPVQRQRHPLWSTFTADPRPCNVARRTVVMAR